MNRLTLIACPECGATAEVTHRFRLAGTGGFVDHLALRCLAGHVFRMPADLLPAEAQRRLQEQDRPPALRHGGG